MNKLKKLFGKINFTWEKVIILSVIMGAWTALMAMIAPEGSSFKDITIYPEWWVLPAIIIIVNSKKPLEAALKTFVFFLISQPLVYLIQVPFNSMGWGLFQYYPCWLVATILTFPGAYLGWFIKKDKWYSACILSVMTGFLAVSGVMYLKAFFENPPAHLLTIIYCFASIIVYMFFILKSIKTRVILGVITVGAMIVGIFVSAGGEPFEVISNTVFTENDIVFVDEPKITNWSGNGSGKAEIYKANDSWVLKISGVNGNQYHFTIVDGEKEYQFEYQFDKDQNTVVVKLVQ
ncbi:hypothetical protein IKE84_02225 [Candidatus Saccharibacteria bacterium]|nr:hypothetical protein [Candidatus Saccharibacteria bacterium]